MPMVRISRWLWLLMMPLLGGCLHGVAPRPAPPVALPATYEAKRAEPGPALGRWWEAFGDQGLNTVVEAALAGNLQLRATWARLLQADALATQGWSGLWPQIQATGSATRQRMYLAWLDRGGGSGGALPGMGSGPFQDLDSFQLGLGASYELDVWGKLTSQGRAAARDLQAAHNDVQAAAMTLAAEAATTWFSLQTQRAALSLLEGQHEANKAMQELVGLRFRQGVAPALDVHQQSQQTAGSLARLLAARRGIQLLEHQLAVLLGKPPGRLALPAQRAELPTLPPLPPTGVPAELIERRPDVRAAQLRVEAADHRVNVALANLFPALRLTGQVGFQSRSLPDLLDALVWSVVGNLTAPLFEGGRRKAQVAQSKAVVEERLNLFGQTVLHALREVHDALSSERSQAEQLQALAKRAEHARLAFDESKSRYLQGISNYLTVLTTLQAHQDAEQQLLQARRDLLTARVQLCRALGGTWAQSVDRADDGSIILAAGQSRATASGAQPEEQSPSPVSPAAPAAAPASGDGDNP
jgi:NodT family efflux transporter outer membrane factor (OMF) lipoprotein